MRSLRKKCKGEPIHGRPYFVRASANYFATDEDLSLTSNLPHSVFISARTGVWRADLAAISSELSTLPGVRRAVVTRVLPDRLRVRVTERVPVAVVHTSEADLSAADVRPIRDLDPAFEPGAHVQNCQFQDHQQLLSDLTTQLDRWSALNDGLSRIVTEALSE